MAKNVAVDCGWGRLIFGQTFADHQDLIREFLAEPAGKRDIGIYIWDHHVLVAQAPELLFVDPSVTYRLWLHNYRPPNRRPHRFQVRLLQNERDAVQINRIYARLGMVPTDVDTILANQARPVHSYFVAEADDGSIIGTITGIDHKHAFDDIEGGASFWCLAVDPALQTRGVGRALVRTTAEHYLARGRQYLDLSVLYDNRPAIRLYRNLGFVRVPVYAVKRRNTINEPFYKGGPAG